MSLTHSLIHPLTHSVTYSCASDSTSRLTFSHLELTQDYVFQALMIWFVRQKCRKVECFESSGWQIGCYIVFHLFQVIHAPHILDVFQTYSMFLNLGLQDSTICGALTCLLFQICGSNNIITKRIRPCIGIKNLGRASIFPRWKIISINYRINVGRRKINYRTNIFNCIQ